MVQVQELHGNLDEYISWGQQGPPAIEVSAETIAACEAEEQERVRALTEATRFILELESQGHRIPDVIWQDAGLHGPRQPR